MIIEKELMQEIINEGAKTGADFVEVFAEETKEKAISMLDSKVDKLSSAHSKGVGIRVALGYNSVYGYTNDITKDSLIKLVKELRSSFNSEIKEVVPLKDLKVGSRHKIKRYTDSVTNEERIEKLTELDKYAREVSPLIVQATPVIKEYEQHVEIAKMDGTYVKDERVKTRVIITSIAKRGNEMESGSANHGMNMGFELFDEEDSNLKMLAHSASEDALRNLDAKDSPSGEMPVIIENGFGGVLFHEAVGHSLEATSVAKNASVFCNKLNERVAHDCVTAIDDGTLLNEWGSAEFDDEGNPQKKRVLIENGILKSYMIDELNGRRMNIESTCSSRRESYKYPPTSRMSNTYIAPGKSSLEDMLKDIKFGLYCKKMGGGSVSPSTGDFNFAVQESYIIRDGKICECVKGASLVGTGRDVLRNIDMVGDNLKLGQGMCGSQSGSIHANVGQPRVRISKITVGGRSK